MGKEEIYGQICATIASLLENVPVAGASERCAINSVSFVEEAAALLARMHAAKVETSDTRTSWIYLRIPMDGSAALTIRDSIRPLVRRLDDSGLCEGWWWLTKVDVLGTALRCRIAVPGAKKVAAENIIAEEFASLPGGVTRVCYEPELCLFGGSVGMSLAHAHFCADSRFLLGWIEISEHRDAQIVPDGLSFALVLRMLRAARLDPFEMWDVFARVYGKRPASRRLDPGPCEEMVAKIMNSGPARVFDLFSGPQRDLIDNHARFLDDFGTQLNAAHFGGQMTCGIREFLAAIILFHWNRSGLSAPRQARLCGATVRLLADLSHGRSTHPRG